METLLPDFDYRRKVFGVAGFGAIGQAVVNLLTQKACHVLVYDNDDSVFHHRNNDKFVRVNSREQLIGNADCILGCTGRDFTKGIDVFDLVVNERVVFASCSSGDKEFLSLLISLSKEKGRMRINPLSDIACWSHAKTDIES